MKYYRVKTGYGKDDFISVSEDELQTAIRAQITGKVAIFKEGTVTGNHIVSIVPDYQREHGWNRGYTLNGEDYDEVGTRSVEEHRVFLESRQNAVRDQIEGMGENLRIGLPKSTSTR